MRFEKHKTKAMTKFLALEGPNGSGRVIGLTLEHDGVWIYTESSEWCDQHGAGGFRGDSETGAIANFKNNVRKGNGDLGYPLPIESKT